MAVVLSAFADDTFFAENTAELAQASGVRASIFKETLLGLALVRVAARKSLVMATAWDRQPGGAVQRRLAGAGGAGGEFADAGRGGCRWAGSSWRAAADAGGRRGAAPPRLLAGRVGTGGSKVLRDQGRGVPGGAPR